MFEPMTGVRLIEIEKEANHYKAHFSDRKRIFNCNVVLDLVEALREAWEECGILNDKLQAAKEEIENSTKGG